MHRFPLQVLTRDAAQMFISHAAPMGTMEVTGSQLSSEGYSKAVERRIQLLVSVAASSLRMAIAVEKGRAQAHAQRMVPPYLS